MPRLPSGESLGQRPVPRGSYSVTSVDTSAVPRAVTAMGGALGRVADEYDREQDANAVFAARRALDDWERDAIFGEKGAAKRLGQEAFGVPDELGKSFDDIAGKVSESLTSNRQRMAFQELANSRRAQVLDWGNKHALREKTVFDAGQFEADIKSMTDRAALFPDRAAGELAIARQRIHGFMRDKGRSTEEIEQAIKDTESRVHGSVIGTMLNAGNGEAATAYFQANRGAMTAEAALRAEAGLKEVTARTRAQGFADDAIAAGMDPRQAEDEARKRFGGTEEAVVISELRDRFGRDAQLKAQAQKEASDAAWKVLANGGSRKSIPPAVWNSLSGEEQRQIADWIESKWRRAKADAEGKQEADWGAFMALTDMARDNPERFMDPQTLLKAEPNLSKQQMATLVTLRTGLSKQDAKSQNLLTQMKETETMVLADMKAAGLDTTPKEGSKQAKELAVFRGVLQDRVMAAQAEKQTALTKPELKAIGLSLVREGYEQGSGLFGMFQTKKRGFEMDPEKTYVAKKYGDIPEDIRKQLDAELPPERGLYGNSRAREEQVERMYTRGQELGRFPR